MMESHISCARYLIVLIGVLVRWCTSLHPYSGQNKPPLFGDYEAQRHWMEVTVNLPIEEWYQNTTRNDLMYWGLDYPPLTAYHMWLCGHVSKILDPESVRFFSSRGYESYEHKIFMRSSVLIGDLLVFFPSIYLYFIGITSSSKLGVKRYNRALLGTLVALTYPGLILIDYGHFQYNCISLGMMAAAVMAIPKGFYKFACVMFTLALNYKQMELYHSLPFFFFFLGLVLKKLSKPKHRIQGILFLLSLAAAVVVPFVLVWLPFISDKNQMLQILHRVFPIYRGIFEDKVANFWCFANIFVKLRNHFSNEHIAKICLWTTAAASLPSCLNLLLKPTFLKFRLSLIVVSLGFFLFSFHVHEKSILLVAVPVIFYFLTDPFPCFWFLTVSTLSLFPLLVRDNLIIPFVALTGLFVLTVLSLMKKFTSFSSSVKNTHAAINAIKTHRFLNGTNVFFISLVGYIILFLGLVCFEPPQRYPDIFPLLIAVYSFVHFISFFAYFNLQQFCLTETKEKNS